MANTDILHPSLQDLVKDIESTRLFNILVGSVKHRGVTPETLHSNLAKDYKPAQKQYFKRALNKLERLRQKDPNAYVVVLTDYYGALFYFKP